METENQSRNCQAMAPPSSYKTSATQMWSKTKQHVRRLDAQCLLKTTMHVMHHKRCADRMPHANCTTMRAHCAAAQMESLNSTTAVVPRGHPLANNGQHQRTQYDPRHGSDAAHLLPQCMRPPTYTNNVPTDFRTLLYRRLPPQMRGCSYNSRHGWHHLHGTRA